MEPHSEEVLSIPAAMRQKGPLQSADLRRREKGRCKPGSLQTWLTANLTQVKQEATNGVGVAKAAAQRPTGSESASAQQATTRVTWSHMCT